MSGRSKFIARIASLTLAILTKASDVSCSFVIRYLFVYKLIVYTIKAGAYRYQNGDDVQPNHLSGGYVDMQVAEILEVLRLPVLLNRRADNRVERIKVQPTYLH